jgi:large subunit ribosomal protein L21
MYAIVNIQGKQFKVSQGQRVYVHRLPQAEGSKVEFNEVLLVENSGNVKIGTPTVSGASVKATVNSHLKGDKVLVFKKKRRKGYKVLRGHRQAFTRITIDEISN